jgi:hypothetical protein
MTAPFKGLYDVVDRIDNAVHLLNAASMATAELDGYQRSAMSSVIDLVLDIVEGCRKDITTFAGLDADQPEAS